ncbi:MAG: RNA polymerase sigma factor [Deltaproteobacteria bacterium]|nr:RNA polymerase sigma factor [Deltaproteobacteria bacterium]
MSGDNIRGGLAIDKERRDVSDDELVAAALRGDDGAFKTLYFRHAPVLARRLRMVLRQPQEVEDVLQMTFLEAHRSLPRHRRDCSFAAWLSRIAYHVTGKHLRSRRRRAWLFFDTEAVPRSPAPDAIASPEQAAGRRQLVDRLFAAMQRLPLKQRVALVMHDMEGLGVTEIGARVDASPQTVWARVQKARRVVRAAFAEKDEGK